MGKTAVGAPVLPNDVTGVTKKGVDVATNATAVVVASRRFNDRGRFARRDEEVIVDSVLEQSILAFTVRDYYC